MLLFAFRKSLVGWWQSRGKQTRAWYPSRSFTCASREKCCQEGLSLHIVSNMNISAGHQSKSRQQFIGTPFRRDPTDEQVQPTLHKYFSVLPLYISTSQSTFELILIQIHTQNYWSRFHDELLFVTFFLDHLCVPPRPPILTWSRVSRSTCETSLRSLLLPGWSYHTSVFHLLSSFVMLTTTTRSSEIDYHLKSTVAKEEKSGSRADQWRKKHHQWIRSPKTSNPKQGRQVKHWGKGKSSRNLQEEHKSHSDEQEQKCRAMKFAYLTQTNTDSKPISDIPQRTKCYIITSQTEKNICLLIKTNI